MPYHHTQVGRLMIATFVFVVFVFGAVFVAGREEMNAAILVLMGLSLLIVGSFSTLTVTVDGANLSIKFGWGIFRKSFPLQDIISVRAARHKWYHGWGIRYWVPSQMWIYNISGFDVVEIEMKDGKKYRIGSDEVEKLVETISQYIPK